MINEFKHLKIGDKDNAGYTVKEIIAAGSDFFIYEIEDGTFRFLTHNAELISIRSSIDPKIEMLKHLAADNKHLNKILNQSLRAIYSLCTRRNETAANQVIQETEKKIIRSKNVSGRLHYLASCMFLILVSLILSIALTVYTPKGSDISLYSYIVLCGSLGSFISISININKFLVDSESPWIINVLAGMSRILIGMIGAVLAYFLIKANIVFGLVTQTGSNYALFAICVMAGFSETFIPNILKKIETQQ